MMKVYWRPDDVDVWHHVEFSLDDFDSSMNIVMDGEEVFSVRME